MKRTTLIVALLAGLLSPLEAMAQTGTDLVEVDPITCWWRTSTTAVRTAEPFGLTLTCAVLETEFTKIVPDVSKLEANVVQLPPFEVLGGTHAADLVTTGKRFFQFDYRLRVIAEDAFGADVSVPPLEVSYRVESKVSGGDSVQGRDQTYALPRASVRLTSIVPDDTTDIREAPAAPFTAIESRLTRATLMQTISTVLFALAGLIALMMFVGLVRTKSTATDTTRKLLAPRAILRAVASELDAVQRASRGGWTAELAARGLAALRIAGSYAAGRSVGQRPQADGESGVEGELLVKGTLGRASTIVSGSVTPQSVPETRAPGLAEALAALTIARYGRGEAFGDGVDDAVATAIRITKQQQSAHSWVTERTQSATRSLVDMRKKVWA